MSSLNSFSIFLSSSVLIPSFMIVFILSCFSLISLLISFILSSIGFISSNPSLTAFPTIKTLVRIKGIDNTTIIFLLKFAVKNAAKIKNIIALKLPNIIYPKRLIRVTTKTKYKTYLFSSIFEKDFGIFIYIYKQLKKIE